MKDFHGFLQKLLTVWLACYALILLPRVLQGLGVFIISDFTLPSKHYFGIINTVYMGGLWLIPTALLAIAWYLSGPGKKLFS